MMILVSVTIPKINYGYHYSIRNYSLDYEIFVSVTCIITCVRGVSICHGFFGTCVDGYDVIGTDTHVTLPFPS